MVFASGVFLFIFLPVIFIGCFLLRNKPVIWRNSFLLIMSIGFYLRSGVKELLLLFCSIIINYICARLIAEKKIKPIARKGILIIAIGYNVGMLFVFKYLSFALSQLSSMIPMVDLAITITLPLGISFYTFQALSYVIDVYRKPELVEKNPLDVALYISLFPQLIAGPIVRWASIRDSLNNPGGVN